MGLGCNYVLLDAQTIQMVKVDEAAGNKGSLGRQFVMQAVAQVREIKGCHLYLKFLFFMQYFILLSTFLIFFWSILRKNGQILMIFKKFEIDFGTLNS